MRGSLALGVLCGWVLLAGAALAQEEKAQPGAPIPPVRADGIASRYPGDVGIEKDPDVLFVENFESPNWADKWQERSQNHRQYGSFETDPAIVLAGKNSLKLLFVPEAGDNAAGWMHYWWDGSDVAYARYYFRLSAGGSWGNVKIMQLHGHQRGELYGRGAGVRPDGTDSFCAGTGVLGEGPIWGGNILYTYHPHQKSGFGDSFGPTAGYNPGIPEETWICKEFMIKLNDLGKLNGEERMWVDGRLVIEKTDLEWRTVPNMVINDLMQPTYTGSPAKTGRHALWLDGIVLAKRYIGPMRPKTD